MVHEQLEAGTACGCAKTAGTCRELLAVEPALWTFVRVEGIEPTNNAAERALRHAILWRKASHGTDSETGSRFVENILTVVATCRQQGRNVLECLTGCCRAALEGTPRVSLSNRSATPPLNRLDEEPHRGQYRRRGQGRWPPWKRFRPSMLCSSHT
jgi:transposase